MCASVLSTVWFKEALTGFLCTGVCSLWARGGGGGGGGGGGEGGGGFERIMPSINYYQFREHDESLSVKHILV